MRPRPRRLFVVALFALLLAGLPAGCSDCDVSCSPADESDYVRFEATYIGEADDVSHTERLGRGSPLLFETTEGTVHVVRLFGDVRALNKGASYRVPAYIDRGADELQASLPRDCGCGPVVTHADGSSIDTGFWAVNFGWWPSWTTLFLVVGVPAAALAAYAFFTRERATDLV